MTALVVAFVSTFAFAQDLKPEGDPGKLGFSADHLNRVTQAFQGFVDSGQIPGAVILIARNDKVAYFQAFGFRDREQNIAMTSDTIFRIASMTKPIVSVGAMMLAEEGKLDIAAPVSKYLPEFKELQVRVEQVDPATGKKGTRHAASDTADDGSGSASPHGRTRLSASDRQRPGRRRLSGRQCSRPQHDAH
jgi:CubicO group peptidase (beta-lactamase class C family)